MRVVHAAAEAVPFSKTGGLADVAGALPKAQAAEGAEASLIAPLHRSARTAARGARKAALLSVPMGAATAECAVLEVPGGPARRFLVDHPAFFDRGGLYGEDGADYADNAERFAFFSRAVLEACRVLGLEPDVLHLHDWQLGPAAALLKTVCRGDPAFAGTASVFTIHNMAYQGVFPKEVLAAAGLPASELSPERMEYWGKVSYLKAGLVHADLLTTVSETYAREIQRPEFGRGMEGVLSRRAADLHGVRNGLDLEVWDPERDAALPRPYGAEDAAEGKAAAKAAVQSELGLGSDPGAFLVASVSRLDAQKGIDLALAAVEPLLARGTQYVLLGAGDPALEDAAKAFAARHPARAARSSAFDDALARRIYAASDAFLMPSRFEPCGLGQLIAMRYGSVPVAVSTGGLADTVPPHGFLAAKAEPGPVKAALAEAAEAFADAGQWARRRTGCMAADWGWGPAARRTLELYALARSRALP